MPDEINAPAHRIVAPASGTENASESRSDCVTRGHTRSVEQTARIGSVAQDRGSKLKVAKGAEDQRQRREASIAMGWDGGSATPRERAEDKAAHR